MCLGIPGQIVEIRGDGDLPMGVVDFGGARREVCLAFVADQARVGDYAVVHVGFAIALVDEAEALRTFQLLQEMGELGEVMGGDRPDAGESRDGSLAAPRNDLSPGTGRPGSTAP